VSHVQGFGQHTGREEDGDGTVLPFGTGEMCKVECIINDELLDSVVALIQEAAHTGEHGDGEIFIIPVEAAVPIRTGRRETVVS
jgi:nitrogen regulatory protein PII